MREEICYLCGRSGADTNDHVPPRAFLGKGNYKGTPRITLPAHQLCNRQFSGDEEYLRDLLAPSSEHLSLPGAETVIEKSDRSRWRPAGFKRRQEFLRYARVIETRSPSGLFLGKALGVPFDSERVNRVGRKIARGIIYHDSGAILEDASVGCAHIPLQCVQEERKNELKKGNSYWEQLGWNSCLHDTFADSVAVRRVYIGHPTVPEITIECSMSVMLLAAFFVVEACFPLPKNGRSTFSFHIDTSTGAWIKSEEHS